ncbi:hypothetical protein SNE40_008146 [Patella caerulea]|uniref:C-type lectin domain-containing protein n=1 Tax=Patella caerulea TaxID=87958 RepID=A0AAN8JY99_PATCE
MTSETPPPETTTSLETSTPSFVCPLSYSMAGGMCFRVHATDASWPDARGICILEGGDLIILDTQQKIDAIAPHISVGLYQIGIHHIYSNGDFEFVDERNQNDVTFNAWRPLEPNSNAGQDSCGRLRHFQWEDGDCNNARKFICEIK